MTKVNVNLLLEMYFLCIGFLSIKSGFHIWEQIDRIVRVSLLGKAYVSVIPLRWLNHAFAMPYLWLIS